MGINQSKSTIQRLLGATAAVVGILLVASRASALRLSLKRGGFAQNRPAARP